MSPVVTPSATGDLGEQAPSNPPHVRGAPGEACLFAAIEPELHRCPAIDPRSFRRAVEAAFGGF